jgi:predicted SPOUT superfamily RNA methylase MTH1
MKNPLELWIAIPDSAISDEQTQRDKSIKISQFARACAIFRVKRIYIYHCRNSHVEKEDLTILTTLLRYLDTPQYLRRILYTRMKELEYAGILHPIKAPHHKHIEDVKNIKIDDVRVGVIVKIKGTLYVEVGLGTLIPYDGKGFEGKKLDVKFTSVYPNLRAKEATTEDIKGYYWGYEVKEVLSLHKLLKGTENTQVLITSRKGSYFKSNEVKLIQRLKSIRNLLIVFGAPKKGVEQILTDEGQSIKPYEFVVNMFPFQGTETVRLEESVLGTLAILNHILSK